MRQKKGTSSAFIGILLVVIGIILFLNSTGNIDISFFRLFAEFWPIGLIIAGIAIMYRQGAVGSAILIITILFLIFYSIGTAGWPLHIGDLYLEFNCTAGSGNVTTITRSVEGFTGVSASSGINVYLDKSLKNTIKIEAEDNIVGLVKTDIFGEILRVHLDGCRRNSKPINVYVPSKNIREISADSFGRIVSKSKITADKIVMQSSSAGVVEIEADANEIEARASSAGEITINGTCTTLTADASSSGRINSLELTARDVNARASSAGVIKVYAEERFIADATSAGRIEYKGDPKNPAISQTSGGVVQKG